MFRAVLLAVVNLCLLLASESPQMILVNRIELTTRRRSLENGVVNYGGTYNYSSGDMVDVFCVNHDFKCNQIEMSNDYAEKLDDMFKSQNVKNAFVESASNLGVGFRATLGAEHKDSHMTCTCRTSDETAIVTVTFVLIEDFEKNANLKINGLRVKHFMYPTRWGITYNLDINYKSFGKEQINVIYDTDKNDIVLEFVKNGYGSCELIKTDQKDSRINISVLVEPERPCHLNFVVKKNGVTKESVKMNISPLPPKFVEFCDKAIVSMNLNLTSEEDEKVTECSLLQHEVPSGFVRLYKLIRVVLHMKVKTTTTKIQTTVTTTDTDYNSQDEKSVDTSDNTQNITILIFGAALGVPALFIALILIAICYKIRATANRMTRNDTRELILQSRPLPEVPTYRPTSYAYLYPIPEYSEIPENPSITNHFESAIQNTEYYWRE